MKQLLLFPFLLFLALQSIPLYGQDYMINKRYTSVGGSANIMNYFGDVTPTSSFTSADIRYTRPDISFHITRRHSARFSYRAAFSYGRIAGDDHKSASAQDKDARYRYLRNAHFRNDIKEFSLVGIWDYYKNGSTFLRRPDFTPYGFFGIALFHHNPKAQLPEGQGDKWIALQPLGTEGQFADDAFEKGYRKPYSRIQLAIPAGIGVRYKISQRMDISFEIGYRFTFTDFLDDVSGNYPAMEDLQSDLARTMSNRTLEGIGAWSGAERATTLQRVQEDTGLRTITYLGSDGKEYSTVNGFGRYGDMRGKFNEKDWYVVTGFQLNYLLVKGVRCPKFHKGYQSRKSFINHIFPRLRI